MSAQHITGSVHRLIERRSGGEGQTREIIDPDKTATPQQGGTLIGYECRSGDFAT